MERMNVVFFLVDDMGYGDAGCMYSDCKIPTPNIDRLAAEGMVFTDAHSTSAVCSPSRYSILTGRYNWRSTLQKGIVEPYGDALIAPDRFTLPKMLKQQGYHTGCVGKWHLGMGWDFQVDTDFYKDYGYDVDTEGASVDASAALQDKWADAFSRPLLGGPIAAGFDTYFGVDVPNWPPYCFIENDQTVGQPSTWLAPWLMEKNMASLYGPAMPYWNFEQLLPTFAYKADAYLRQRAEQNEPFFLYMPMTSPHTPLSVNKKWIGSSGLNNLYADLVVETDAVLGQVLNALDRYDLTDNTLVIFTSDNGCAPYIGIEEMEAQGHYPSGEFRGYKSDAWDGGHRIPLIARWPKRILPGRRCDALVSLSDWMATIADALDCPVPENAAEDSISLMPIINEPSQAVRDVMIQHSMTGKFAIRDKTWKLILCPGSGGWNLPDEQAVEMGLPLVQLYNMKDDPREQNNVYRQHPERVKSMLAQLEEIVQNGRSTPGAPQSNDIEVDIWKLDTLPGVDEHLLDDIMP